MKSAYSFGVGFLLASAIAPMLLPSAKPASSAGDQVVEIPDVGSISVQGAVTKGEISGTSLRKAGDQLFVITPKIGFHSQNGKARQAGVEGVGLITEDRGALKFLIASKSASPRDEKGQLPSMDKLVNPQGKALCVSGRRELEGTVEVKLEGFTGDGDKMKSLATLLAAEGETFLTIFLNAESVLLVSPYELEFHESKGGFFRYRKKR